MASGRVPEWPLELRLHRKRVPGSVLASARVRKASQERLWRVPDDPWRTNKSPRRAKWEFRGAQKRKKKAASISQEKNKDEFDGNANEFANVEKTKENLNKIDDFRCAGTSVGRFC